MNRIDLVLWILAAVFFGLAMFNAPAHPRLSWIAAGLFCATLTVLT